MSLQDLQQIPGLSESMIKQIMRTSFGEEKIPESFSVFYTEREKTAKNWFILSNTPGEKSKAKKITGNFEFGHIEVNEYGVFESEPQFFGRNLHVAVKLEHRRSSKFKVFIYNNQTKLEPGTVLDLNGVEFVLKEHHEGSFLVQCPKTGRQRLLSKQDLLFILGR